MIINDLEHPDVLPKLGIVHLPHRVGMLPFERTEASFVDTFHRSGVDLEILVDGAGRAFHIEGYLRASVTLAVTDRQDLLDLLPFQVVGLFRSAALVAQGGEAALLPSGFPVPYRFPAASDLLCHLLDPFLLGQEDCLPAEEVDEVLELLAPIPEFPWLTFNIVPYSISTGCGHFFCLQTKEWTHPLFVISDLF